MDNKIPLEDTRASNSTLGTHRSGVITIFLVAAILVALFLKGNDLAGLAPAFATWVESIGIWGPFVFATGYAIATVAMVPGLPLTLVAGAIFGLTTGIATVFIGASVGATLAFLVSRYVARSWVEQKLEGYEKFAAIDSAVGKKGMKIVMLLRLSPLVPFNLLNYALGLTSVRLREYVLAHLAMLPATFLYVYYGHLAGTVAKVASGAGGQRDGGYYALLGLGLVATLILTTIIMRISTQVLSGITDEP